MALMPGVTVVLLILRSSNISLSCWPDTLPSVPSFSILARNISTSEVVLSLVNTASKALTISFDDAVAEVLIELKAVNAVCPVSVNPPRSLFKSRPNAVNCARSGSISFTIDLTLTPRVANVSGAFSFNAASSLSSRFLSCRRNPVSIWSAVTCPCVFNISRESTTA